MLRRLSSNCASFVAPGRSERPCPVAYAATQAPPAPPRRRARARRSRFRGRPPRLRRLCRRTPSSSPLFMRPSPPAAAFSGKYLPVRAPFLSGDHARIDMPNSSAIGSSSRSTVRSSKLYSICNPTYCVQPRSSARVFDCATTHAGRVGNADVEHFSGAHEVVERAHDFFGRRHRVPDVQPVEIDVVGAEALEARLDGLHHVLLR